MQQAVRVAQLLAAVEDYSGAVLLRPDSMLARAIGRDVKGRASLVLYIAALGLAFLNDIQVYTFLEMAQGDMRSNIMQAPKLTLFNGQTATLAVTDQQFFVTSVSVLAGQNGQIVFVPNNTPLSGPDTNFNIAIQAVVSADRLMSTLPVLRVRPPPTSPQFLSEPPSAKGASDPVPPRIAPVNSPLLTASPMRWGSRLT